MFQKFFQLIILKKAYLYGYVYDISVNYDSIDVDDILDIHKCLMKRYSIK